MSSTAGCGPGSSRWPRAEPDRYLVLDAATPTREITEQIKDRIREILPDPVPRTTEAVDRLLPRHPGRRPDDRSSRTG